MRASIDLRWRQECRTAAPKIFKLVVLDQSGIRQRPTNIGAVHIPVCILFPTSRKLGVHGFPAASHAKVQRLVPSALEVLQFKMLSVNQVYAALEGVVYVTNREGKLIGRGEPNWSDFAIKNSAPELSEATELNCYSACSGDDTYELYKKIYDALWTRKLARHSSAFRCDSPSRRREYRLTLTPLIGENGVIGILHQSLPVSETLRPPLDIFNPEYRRAFFDGPLVRICSYCLSIWDETDGAWIEAELYYQKGGSSQVQLTHGVCSSCKEKVLAPLEQSIESLSSLSDYAK